MPLKFEIIGIKSITKKFTDSKGITKAIDGGMDETVSAFVQSRMAGQSNYPSPIGSSYGRTGTLGDSWLTKKEGWMRHAITNATSYAIFVVGDGAGLGQAWMHVGRWWTARTRIDEALPNERKAIRDNHVRFLN
jgi:hypothetical protein